MTDVFFPRQQDVIRALKRGELQRLNIFEGSVRSGKTHISLILWGLWVATMPPDHDYLMTGRTVTTLKRNCLEPMIILFGERNFKYSTAAKEGRLFGRRVYLEGAHDARSEGKIRGMTLAGAYCDELTLFPEDFFRMLISRLSVPGAKLIATTNPDNPGHWLKTQFLDREAELGLRRFVFRLEDNTFLPEEYVEELKKEYSGTVYYDRFILGKWVAAEGAIYRVFADRPEPFFGVPADGEIRMVWIGIDFGGNGSAHAACVVGTDARLSKLWVLDEYYRKEVISPTQLERDLVGFVQSVKDRWRIAGIYADSAEQVLIRGLNAAFAAARLPEVGNSRKKPINDRIRFTTRMMGAGRFTVNPDCRHTIEALRTARWDPRHPTEDKRLDDGTVNVDSLDAMEYAFERQMGDFIR